LAGLLLVPRLLALVARYKSREMLLITVLGLCFGFCLLVVEIGYSMALGAFVMGAIMAESRQIKQIESLVEPLRDMFSAIFFVTIGMLVDPAVISQYWQPILLITLVVVVGKVVSCTVGTLVSGTDARTSLKVGMGLAQIGEFSFIIATLGLTLGVTSSFLYPIVVAVSVLTTLLTPYLIRASDPLADLARRYFPGSWHDSLAAYSAWLSGLGPSAAQAQMTAIIRRILVHVLLNFCVIAGIFLAVAFVLRESDFSQNLPQISPAWHNTAYWLMSLVLSVPFMVAAYRKLEALSLILAELTVGGPAVGLQSFKLRQLLARVLPVLALLAMLLLIAGLSSILLPPLHLFVAVLVLAMLLALTVWPAVVRWHSQVQIALRETLAEEPPAAGQSDKHH
jgi:CPA2 family monovalent cation:H+ antiporter-2